MTSWPWDVIFPSSKPLLLTQEVRMPDNKSSVQTGFDIANLSLGVLAAVASLLKHTGSLGKNGENTVAFKVGHVIEQVVTYTAQAEAIAAAVIPQVTKQE